MQNLKEFWDGNFLNCKTSKDGQWLNVSKYSLPTEKSFKKKDLCKAEKSRQFSNNHLK